MFFFIFFIFKFYNIQEIPFINAKLINDEFNFDIKKLILVSTQTIGTNHFWLYKEKEEVSEDYISEWRYESIIRINDYYVKLTLGDEFEINVQDIVGNDNVKEIVINTGCFSDAGCLGEIAIIRLFGNQPFTLTNFGQVDIANVNEDLPSIYGSYKIKYSKSKYQQDLIKSNKFGEFNLIERIYENKCYLLIRSIGLTKRGFTDTKTVRKKLPIECAG